MKVLTTPERSDVMIAVRELRELAYRGGTIDQAYDLAEKIERTLYGSVREEVAA